MSKDQSYADDEVRDIIERALKEQPTSAVSHEDLLSIGAGVGLSRAAVESAAREVADARLTKTATTRVVSRRRRGFRRTRVRLLGRQRVLVCDQFSDHTRTMVGAVPGVLLGTRAAPTRRVWLVFPGVRTAFGPRKAAPACSRERRRRTARRTPSGRARRGPVDQIEDPMLDGSDADKCRAEPGARSVSGARLFGHQLGDVEIDVQFFAVFSLGVE